MDSRRKRTHDSSSSSVVDHPHRREHRPKCPSCEEPVQQTLSGSRYWQCPDCRDQFLWCVDCQRFSQLERTWVFAHQDHDALHIRGPVLAFYPIVHVEEGLDVDFRDEIQRCHRLYGPGYSRGKGLYKGGDMVELMVEPGFTTCDFLESALGSEFQFDDMDDTAIKFKMWVTGPRRSATGFRVSGFWGPRLNTPIPRAISAQRVWMTVDPQNKDMPIWPPTDRTKRASYLRDTATCGHCHQPRTPFVVGYERKAK